MLVLFQSCGRTFRRAAEHQLSFGHHSIANARADLELPKLTDLRQFFSFEQNLFFRPNRAEKFYPANPREQKERPRIFGKTGSARDAGGLGERLSQDDTGDERITGKMAGENRIVGRKNRRALGVLARLAVAHLPNENERRTMRKARQGRCFSHGVHKDHKGCVCLTGTL